MPRRRVGGGRRARKHCHLPLPECTRLCSRIDAISIIITEGAGSPLKEGSHVRIIHARQRCEIRIGL